MCDCEFLRNDVIKVNKEFLEEIKIRAKNSPSGKYRYCLHKSENSDMQEMIFVNAKEQYNPPDKHNNYAETKIVLDGEAWILLFEDSGEIREIFKASAESIRFCRVEKGIYHAIWPITDQVVIYEVREGKHTSDSSIFPEWAPRDGVTNEQIKYYREFVENAIRKNIEKGK